MKKILCYFGVFFLFILAILPPIFRAFLPDRNNSSTSKNDVLLVCTGNRYITTTNYEGDKIKTIIIKRMTNIDNEKSVTAEDSIEGDEENQDDDLPVLLDTDFDKYKRGDVLFDRVSDGELITIDFTVSNHPELELDNIYNPVDTQQQIYESENLVCTISK